MDNYTPYPTTYLYQEICTNCGLTYGSHKSETDSLGPNSLCPGHEGYMDWRNSPGTTFQGSGKCDLIPMGTPAKSLRKPHKLHLLLNTLIALAIAMVIATIFTLVIN